MTAAVAAPAAAPAAAVNIWCTTCTNHHTREYKHTLVIDVDSNQNRIISWHMSKTKKAAVEESKI